MEPIIVIDNGSCKCRVGLAGEAAPRGVAKARGDSRLLLGGDIDEARTINRLNLRRPFDRGFIVNWNLEQGIWSRMLDHYLPDVRVLLFGR
jgi:actin-related protein 6